MTSVEIRFVELNIKLHVEFGNNLYEWIFLKLTKSHDSAGPMQFELFEKVRVQTYFLIEGKNSCHFFLITNNKITKSSSVEHTCKTLLTK